MFHPDISIVENKIREIVNSAKESDLIYSAISYVVDSGGKRIRPALTIIASHDLRHLIGEFDYDKVLDAAACVELMHTASLILDDVVDNSGSRRGNPSLNAIFGNKIAVISASYLLGAISHRLAEIGDVDLIRNFSLTAKVMAEGEMLEFNIMADNIPTFLSKEDVQKTYLEVVRKKTASLFSLCASIPAILGRAELHEIGRFGLLLGMAFQIKDDILDFISDITGKPRLKDVSEGKITLPIILSDNFERIVTIMREWKSRVDEIPWDISFDIFRFVQHGGGIQRAEQELIKIKNEILGILRVFASSDHSRVSNLRKLIDFIIERNF